VKAVYLALGINLAGEKEILGLWIAQSEGAKFWLQVVTVRIFLQNSAASLKRMNFNSLFIFSSFVVREYFPLSLHSP